MLLDLIRVLSQGSNGLCRKLSKRSGLKPIVHHQVIALLSASCHSDCMGGLIISMSAADSPAPPPAEDQAPSGRPVKRRKKLA